jgi:hypothetical protein
MYRMKECKLRLLHLLAPCNARVSPLETEGRKSDRETRAAFGKGAAVKFLKKGSAGRNLLLKRCVIGTKDIPDQDRSKRKAQESEEKIARLSSHPDSWVHLQS